jgi:hypothetical protein
MAASKLKWYQTKQGYALLALLEFVAAYLLASLAIDSGSLLQWVVTIALLVAAVQNLGKLAFSFWKKG